MIELLIGILTAMLAYFLMRLDNLEKKIDLIENHLIEIMAKRSDDTRL
jgi:hypothetical protein